MSYTTNTPRQLKDLILRRLGAPVINIEITEDQIYDCIQRALELFGEYHYSGLNKNYYIIKVNEEQSKTGLFNLKWPVFAVQKIVRSNSSAITGMGGGTVYNWVQDFVQQIFSNNLQSGQCYSQSTLTGMGGNLQYYTQMMSSMNLMQDILNPLPEYYYNQQNKQLQVYKNFAEGDLLIIEAYTKSFNDDLKFEDNYNKAGTNIIVGQSQANQYTETKYQNPIYYKSDEIVQNLYSTSNEQDVFNNRWIKDYATSLVKELWGQILSKHQGMSLPGGITIDGNRLIQEAKEEIEHLREELYQLTLPDMIIYG